MPTPVRPHLPQRAVRGTLTLTGVAQNDRRESSQNDFRKENSYQEKRLSGKMAAGKMAAEKMAAWEKWLPKELLP